MTKELLSGFVRQGLTVRAIASKTGKSYTTIRYWLTKYNLHTVGRAHKFSWKKNLIVELLKESHSISDFLKKAGLAVKAGNFNTFYKYVQLYDINAKELFIKEKQVVKTKHDKETLFTRNSQIGRATVRRYILKLGLLPYQCSECGQEPTWMGKPMSLILDHKDGDAVNHQLNNLRFLCPNCNATLETHCKGVKK